MPTTEHITPQMCIALLLRCKVKGDRVPAVDRVFDSESALKENELGKDRESGEEEESHNFK